ncbi:isoprenylcysteine carboxyl methyltransferase (ICMT) family protein [Peptococcaceae bacterium CEB3]|nr:isoprenylcysteine carboxyl methyltransferase (ICMT) family protein [Peptococcaceae bacterium CEB3]
MEQRSKPLAKSKGMTSLIFSIFMKFFLGAAALGVLIFMTTGPYAVVRHPSYVGDLVLVLGIPLALGSWWGLILFALMIPAMVRMIHDEERLLKDGLPGYAKYTETVRYRLIPYIW